MDGKQVAPKSNSQASDETDVVHDDKPTSLLCRSDFTAKFIPVSCSF
jgi:hypothetical protein